ncbi:MAG: HAD family phosphatase [Oscillospiraceae bacterium]|nr:HAD family phosphatase [Oscillospiraceae bacterium]
MTYPEKPYSGLALLTDLDGTLLTPEKTVSPEDAAAIAEFRRKGGLFSIATGRGTQASQEFLALLKPDFPVVMYNGALLYDPAARQTVGAAHLPAGTKDILLEMMREFPDVGAEVLAPDGVFVLQENDYERQHLEITHIPLVRKTLDEVPPEHCYKALFAGAPERISEMLEFVKQERFSIVSFTRSHQWFLELLPHDTSKGTALTKLRAFLPENTVIGAAGDFDNDTAMLLAADDCGCPADSQPSVRRAVADKGGFLSEKTCKNGFFADWIAEFVRRCKR